MSTLSCSVGSPCPKVKFFVVEMGLATTMSLALSTLSSVRMYLVLQIHWLSIINSVVLVCLLLGFVVLILVSTMLCI